MAATIPIRFATTVPPSPPLLLVATFLLITLLLVAHPQQALSISPARASGQVVKWSCK